MAGKRVDVGLRPHIPDPRRSVPAGRHQHVYGRVQGDRVHGGQVAVVVSDHFVVL